MEVVDIRDIYESAAIHFLLFKKAQKAYK